MAQGTKQHNTRTKYEEVPSILTNYVCPDLVNAPCRFVRSSMSYLPENASAFSKSGVPFTLTFTPFAEADPEDASIPSAERPPGPVLRCERCRVFANPFFAFKDNWKRYVCNLCGLESEINPQCIDKTDYSPEKYPETAHSVSSVPMVDSTRLFNVSGNNILVCLDFSLESMANGAFFHCLSSLRSSIDALPEDTNLGLALWDATVCFFKFDVEDDAPILVRSADSTNPAAGVAPADVLFNTRTQTAELHRAIDFFEQFGEAHYRDHNVELRNTPHCLEQLALVVSDFFADQAGHVLVFASVHQKKPREAVVYPPSEKSPMYRPRSAELSAAADKLAARCVSLDLFLTPTATIELSSVSDLAVRTGGRVYFYPSFKLITDAERFFYDIYRAVTVPRVFDVAVRLRHSPGLHIMEYFTPRGPASSLDFQLPSLSADQSIIAHLKLSENLRDMPKAQFQLAVLYTTGGGCRWLRTFNFGLQTTTDMTLFFKQLKCEALGPAWLRMFAWRLRQVASAEMLDELSKAVEKLFRYYRFEVGGRYEAKEFALPVPLQHLPLYISSFLARPCLTPRPANSLDVQVASMLEVLSLSPAALLCLLYPKIFDLCALFERVEAEADDSTLPESLPATQKALSQDGAYLIDNGVELVVYLSRRTPAKVTEELIGPVDLLVEGATLQSLDHLPFNQRVHHLIEQLRALKGGAVQAVRVATEENSPRGFLQTFLVEDCPTPYSANYWGYLTHLHDRVREE